VSQNINSSFNFNIMQDNPVLPAPYGSQGPAFVTFGETMLRDMPADNERLERTRQVWISLAGSEFSAAVLLSRLGIPSAYVTRVPDNPYGWMQRSAARENGVNADYFVWADKTEPVGRYLYELGRTPRTSTGWYQRKYSAASKLGAGMVDWKTLLAHAHLFHTTGISYGLSTHSGYEHNYLLEAFQEAMQAKPASCLVGMDFNYRSTLWSMAQCKAVLTPLLEEHVDILVTAIEDMAAFYNLGCGPIRADTLDQGDDANLEDADLQEFLQQVIERFNLKVAAITRRYPDSLEQNRWEAAAMDADGHFFRSPVIQSITLWDRLGGGDAWTAGFYYGLLTGSDTCTDAAAPVNGLFQEKALAKGVLVGDAATILKQTLMYDLPILSRQEIQGLLDQMGSAGKAFKPRGVSR
jgi:2-dehydro-3-deoxygluconokinase